MGIASIRRHPSLQFRPSRWEWEDGALATILFARGDALIAMAPISARGDQVADDVYRWAGDERIVLKTLSNEQNSRLRKRILDGQVWLELWSLWPWGWSRDTSARPCSGPPSALDLDAAAARLAEGLPKGLPIVPNRWLPSVATPMGAQEGD